MRKAVATDKCRRNVHMIDPARLTRLNNNDTRRGKYVLYWMQQSQRADCNHALEYAIREANRLRLPVLATFGLTQRFPDANLRHYAFMLEGLSETQHTLRTRGIQLVLRLLPPPKAAVALSRDAAMVVTDCGYLRIQKKWRENVASRITCAMLQVESDVIVPVETASDKEEFAARTIRPKIHKHLDRFLKPLEETTPVRDSLSLKLDSLQLDDIDSTLESLRIDRSVGKAASFKGGATQARKLLAEFLSHKLPRYTDDRNDPNADCVSHMSPYLHFGQISPLHVALQTAQSRANRRNVDAYLEELIVRRELSMNFCRYNPRYDQFDALPDWAKDTLRRHRKDPRPYLYSLDDLERAQTHDPYWNAAQNEMLLTGKMHNYMRMYWGKKIVEWSPTPEDAFRHALHLNNKYELDGRDPNSFAGVAWCFGKHDRPWTRRPVFGTVRYMNAAGLDRKFDMNSYVHRIAAMQRL